MTFIQMMASQDECCFLINMPLRHNLFTGLFCVFAGLPVRVAQRANLKLRRDAVCRSVSAAVTLRIGLLAQYRHSRECREADSARSAESETHTHANTHSRLNIQPRRLPVLPVLTLFFHCGAAPDFMATGPEWRGENYVTSYCQSDIV